MIERQRGQPNPKWRRQRRKVRTFIHADEERGGLLIGG